MADKFAEVYVKLPVDSSFTYKIPDNFLVEVGFRVKINFGGQKTIGFVHQIHFNPPADFEPREILEVIDQEALFNQELVSLAQFTAKNYISSVGEALSMALPAGLKASARYKIPFEIKPREEIELSAEQEKIYKRIIFSYEKGELYHLLFGVTGSGKTEIYINLAKYFLNLNRSVIYLVPEISLSSQIFERLYNTFPDDLLIYHSHLTANQRLHHWQQFYQGKAKIVIGTRSAVFLQAPNLGMIVIDEEHDASYKEHSTPRYNAKGVAFHRAQEDNALVVMGSATPSFEALYASEKNTICRHDLVNRFNDAQLPKIEVVEIESYKPNKIISSKLNLFIKQTVEAGQQVVLLLNRRGFSPYILCDDCGEIINCPSCQISLTYHSNNFLFCHYCGFKKKMPLVCEKCHSPKLLRLGIGTQQLEELVNKTFPNFKIFRLDQDTSRKKNVVFDLIKKINTGNIDIILGTQMVAKGFDFDKVTLVGVPLAEIGLNLPDFRSSERVFALLLQVAGRSGRRAEQGKVILQTRNEENPFFEYLKNHDYYSFYKSELKLREQLFYPPFARLARLLVRGTDQKKVIEAIKTISQELYKIIKQNNFKIDILGPSQAPLGKIASNFRYHLILKSKEIKKIREVIKKLKQNFKPTQTYLEIDLDPYEMM